MPAALHQFEGEADAKAGDLTSPDYGSSLRVCATKRPVMRGSIPRRPHLLWYCSYMKRKIKPELSLENAEALQAKIENEGDFLYVMQNWDFKDFKDKKFNALRKALVKAAQDLIDYCRFERFGEDLEVDETACESCGDTLDRVGRCETCG